MGASAHRNFDGNTATATLPDTVTRLQVFIKELQAGVVVVGGSGGDATCAAASQKKKDSQPRTLSDMQNPATMARNAGFTEGKAVHRKGHADGVAKTYLITSVAPEETTLQECTFDHDPETVTEITKDITKTWTLHRGQLQVKIPANYDDPMKNADWESDSFSAAMCLAIRSVMKSTAFSRDSVELYKSPFAVRVTGEHAKGTLRLVAASTLISKKASPTSIGVAKFETLAGGTVD